MPSLKPVARAVLNRKCFRRPIADYISGKIEWNDASLKNVKSLVRAILRVEQGETCPYCQRLIIPERRNVTEHIEHFLDKSKAKYRKFAFSTTNLVLSCQGCNIEKGTRDLMEPGIAAPAFLTAAVAPFRWPHPYYDDITACIQKDPGPVYSIVPGSGREAQAIQMIMDLKLSEIQNVESRHGKLCERQIRLMSILGRLARKNDQASRTRMAPLIIELEKVNRELG